MRHFVKNTIRYAKICQIFLALTTRPYVLGGEGILALEAACATLTEPGDKVLVIDNGIFGRGFADFVSLYGGEPTLYTVDYHYPIVIEDLAEYLKKKITILSTQQLFTVIHQVVCSMISVRFARC